MLPRKYLAHAAFYVTKGKKMHPSHQFLYQHGSHFLSGGTHRYILERISSDRKKVDKKFTAQFLPIVSHLSQYNLGPSLFHNQFNCWLVIHKHEIRSSGRWGATLFLNGEDRTYDALFSYCMLFNININKHHSEVLEDNQIKW